jgi:endonuclease YncB( thermonuclease family)
MRDVVQHLVLVDAEVKDFALRVVILTVLILAATQARAEPIMVVDGDTLAAGTERIRILGIDTPESYNPQCNAERRRAFESAGAVQHLIWTRKVRIERTGRKDRYGRTLAKVYVGVPERDIAEILVSEGFARPYSGGKRQSWCRNGAERPGSF